MSFDPRESHFYSESDYIRMLADRDAEIEKLKAIIKELEENIYAAGVFVEQM